MTWQRDERGSIAPFVVIISLGLLLLGALVIDGGRQLNAKGRAVAYAQEAARAGAQAVDIGDPELDVDPRLARRAAQEYCDEAQAADGELTSCVAGIVRASNGFTVVSVSARVSPDAVLLGMINRPKLHADGTATARPISGITEADDSKASKLPPPDVAPPRAGGPPPTAPVKPIETLEPCIPPDDDEDDPEDPDSDEPGPDRPGPDDPGSEDPDPDDPDRPGQDQDDRENPDDLEECADLDPEADER